MNHLLGKISDFILKTSTAIFFLIYRTGIMKNFSIDIDWNIMSTYDDRFGSLSILNGRIKKEYVSL